MSQPTEPDLPLHDPEENTAYSIEIAARLAGVNTDTILHYQEQGLIRTTSADSDKPQLDDEALRTLRQIEHLRETCKVNDNGLRLILGLMEELEQLRSHLHNQR